VTVTMGVLLSLVLLLAGGKENAPISFGQLEPLETIRVRFNSTGCFHSRTYELTFRRRSSYAATVREVTTPIVGAAPKRSRTTVLSSTRVAGLDRLLEYYRRESPGGCTTVELVTITRLSANGTPIATEQYVDESCGTQRLDGVTLLPDLRYQNRALRPSDFQEF
jgi:hypothetical protein